VRGTRGRVAGAIGETVSERDRILDELKRAAAAKPAPYSSAEVASANAELRERLHAIGHGQPSAQSALAREAAADGAQFFHACEAVVWRQIAHHQPAL
jgi:hypothetical protein